IFSSLIMSNSSDLSQFPPEWIRAGEHLFQAHGQALKKAQHSLPSALGPAVAMILERPGKVVLTGIGKSGQVAQKIASSLSSTGTPALYLNASEALHGDLGVVSPGDTV